MAADQYRPPELSGPADLLDRPVRERPDAHALIVTGARAPVTYRCLAAMADQVAGTLAGAGLRRGDVVAVVSPNTVEFVVALLGAARAGLVVAPLDPALADGELAPRIAELGARAAVAPGGRSCADWVLRVDAGRAGAVDLSPARRCPCSAVPGGPTSPPTTRSSCSPPGRRAGPAWCR
ncbi:AMP-binding protein [Streptomyces sp. Q6]|uniref:AMP-binding protein n=1 Tax=Streptomyces citrinus TaxID=3118173 RepID=A0ACD5AKL3_9ACTN